MKTTILRAWSLVVFLFVTIACSSVAPAQDRTAGADWAIGVWQYYQTDETTWLFDVSVTRKGPYYEFRLIKCNETVYRYIPYAKFQSGRLVSRLRFDAEKNLFYGEHFRVEDGAPFDKVRVEVVNWNLLRYHMMTRTSETGQSMRRVCDVSKVGSFGMPKDFWEIRCDPDTRVIFLLDGDCVTFVLVRPRRQ